MSPGLPGSLLTEAMDKEREQMLHFADYAIRCFDALFYLMVKEKEK